MNRSVGTGMLLGLLAGFILGSMVVYVGCDLGSASPEQGLGVFAFLGGAVFGIVGAILGGALALMTSKR